MASKCSALYLRRFFSICIGKPYGIAISPGIIETRRKKLFLRLGVSVLERAKFPLLIAISGPSPPAPPFPFPSISGIETAAELNLFILHYFLIPENDHKMFSQMRAFIH